MLQNRGLQLETRCLHPVLVAALICWSLLGGGESPPHVGSTKQLFLSPVTEDGRDETE